MEDDKLELNMRATLETEEVKKGTKEIEDSIKKMEETNKNAHEQIQAQTEKTGTVWMKVFNLSNAVSLVKNGAEMIIGAVKSQIGAVVMDFRDAADDQADAIDGVNLQLQNMGIYTDELSEQLQDHAKALEQVTNYSDQAILEGDKMLLTFENLSGEIMPRATEAMLDMSAVMGTDLKSSVQTIGKALQDPIDGLDRLSKQGFDFTEQQKAMIKKFVEQNDIMSAQNIILDELDVAYGGHAKLQVDAVEQSKNAWQNLKEVLGAKLQPTVDKLFELATKLMNALTTSYWQDNIKKAVDFALAVDKIVGKVLWWTANFEKLSKAWQWFTRKMEETDIKGQASNFEMLSNRLLELKSKTNLTASETAIYHDTIKLQSDYGDYLKNVNLEKDSYDKVAGAIRNASAALQKNSAIKLAQLEIDTEVKKSAEEKEKWDKKIQKEYDKMDPIKVYVQQRVVNGKLVQNSGYMNLNEAEYNKYVTTLKKIINATTGYTEEEKRLAGYSLELAESGAKKQLEKLKDRKENISEYNENILSEEERLQAKTKEIMKKYGVTDSDVVKPETSVGTGEKLGGGDGEDTEKKLNTEMPLDQQIKEIEKQAEVKKVSADEYEKKIIDINTKRDIAILKEEMRVKDLISEIKARYELTKDIAEKEKLQKEVDKLSNETIDKKAAINKKAEEEIKVIKDNAKAEAEAKAKAIQDAKQAETDAEKKAEEKYKQEAEDRRIARERAREKQRENVSQNSNEKRLERGEAYASQVVGLGDIGTNLAESAMRDKKVEELKNYNSLLEQLYAGEFLYKNENMKKLAEADKRDLEMKQAKIVTELQLEKDMHDFKAKLGGTSQELANKLVSGEIKNIKQVKELGKQKLKDFLVNKGQEHAFIAVSEGGLMLKALAAQEYPIAGQHALAMAENAAIAAAFGTGANAIKMPSSGDKSDNNNQNNNLPGSAASAEKKKELVINTDNQAVIRLLIPEFAQALDDGYSISKK